MTEKRFNYTSEKIGQHWGIEISDNQTKQPFDVDYIEITDNYSQTKDNVKFIVELLNNLHDENKEYKQRVKETLQTFYNTTKQLKGEKLLIIGYLDLIKHIADELGVDLE